MLITVTTVPLKLSLAFHYPVSMATINLQSGALFSLLSLPPTFLLEEKSALSQLGPPDFHNVLIIQEEKRCSPEAQLKGVCTSQGGGSASKKEPFLRLNEQSYILFQRKIVQNSNLWYVVSGGGGRACLGNKISYKAFPLFVKIAYFIES